MATLGELKRRKAAAEFEKEHGSQEKQLPMAEITTAVVVVLILLVFGIPKVLKEWNGFKVNGEVNQFVDNMIAAQNTALDTKQPVIVTIDPENGTYSMRNGKRVEDRSLGSHIRFSTNPDFELLDIWGAPLENKPINLLNGENEFSFDTQGAVSHNGAIYLVPTQDIGKTTENMMALQILKTSGATKILRYTGNPGAPWGIPVVHTEPIETESKDTKSGKKSTTSTRSLDPLSP